MQATALAHQLLLFKAVAEQLSFSRASLQTGVSKGQLSKQVRALEEQLGVQLLLRSTRSVQLTAEGHTALAQARQLLQHVEASQSRILEQQHTLRGTLTLTAPAAFAEHRLIEVCHEFTQQHPGLQIQFDVGNELREVDGAGIDLAIRITHAPPQNMVARPLTDISYWCVAAPAYFAQHGKPASPADLAAHNCISLSFWRKWTFFHHSNTQLVEATGSQSYPQNALLRKAALLGIGVINVPSYLVEEDVAAGRLEKVLDDYIAEPRLVYVIYPHRPHQPLKLRTFVDFLLAHPAFNQKS